MISKSVIQDFANTEANESIQIIYDHLHNAAYEILDSLSKKNPLIHPEKCLFFLRDDYFFNVQTPKSEMRFVLAIESAHIELNSSKLVLNQKSLFKKEFKNFFFNRRKSKRKMKKQMKKQSTLVLKPENYDIVAFQREFFMGLADYFTATTVIRNMTNEIKILSEQELGINISISVAIRSADLFKFWNDDTNDFDIRNYFEENQIIEKKNNDTNKQYLKMVKVFLSLFDAFDAGLESHYLAMCLLKEVPNDLYSSNIHESFLKIINYLMHANYKSMKGIIKPDKLLFGESGSISISMLEAKKLVKSIAESLDE